MEIKKSIETNITLNEGMKITLDLCFRALHGCLGWICHNEENDTYYGFNSNNLGLMDEDLTLELFEIEEIIITDDCQDYVLVFKVDYDCDGWAKDTKENCVKSILVCWSGGEE